MWVSLFSKAVNNRMRGHSLKLHFMWFRLDIRKNFFTKGLLSIKMDCSGRWWIQSLEVFKKDGALSAMLWLTRSSSVKGWTEDPGGLFQTK